MKNLYVIVLIVFLFSACNKEKLSVPHTVVQLPINCKIERIVFVNDSTLFACGGIKLTSGYVFKSTNKGKNWNVVYQGVKKINSIFFVNEQNGFACGDSLAFIRTTNSGNRWIDTMRYEYFWNQERANLNDLFFWSNKRGFMGGGKNSAQGNFYSTFDAGDFISCIHKNNEIHRVVFPSPNRGFAVCFGMIYRLFDSVEFVPPYNFSIKHEIADIQGDIYTGASFINANTGWVCGYNGGIYKTADGGYSWQTVSSSNNRYTDIVFCNEALGYAVGEDGFIARTENSGKTWHELDCEQSNNDNVQCIAYRNNLIICGTENGKIIIIKQ